MNTVNMDEKLHWFAYQLRLISWQIKLSIVLFILCAILLTFTHENTNEVDRLHLLIDDLSGSLSVKTEVKTRPNAIVHQFYSALPRQKEANEKLTQILDLIERNGLKLARSDYSIESVSQSNMLLYHIRFPLEGGYLTIRKIVNQIMNTHATIALSHIDFFRDDIRSEHIKSNIEFVLYTKAERSQ